VRVFTPSDAGQVFDREGRNACDVREVGTILRSMDIYPTEKQLQRCASQYANVAPRRFGVARER